MAVLWSAQVGSSIKTLAHKSDAFDSQAVVRLKIGKNRRAGVKGHNLSFLVIKTQIRVLYILLSRHNKMSRIPHPRDL